MHSFSESSFSILLCHEFSLSAFNMLRSLLSRKNLRSQSFFYLPYSLLPSKLPLFYNKFKSILNACTLTTQSTPLTWKNIPQISLLKKPMLLFTWNCLSPLQATSTEYTLEILSPISGLQSYPDFLSFCFSSVTFSSEF